MRPVVLFVATSLDNYVARNDGKVDWLFTDRDYGTNDFFKTLDTALIGRKTHDQMVSFGIPAYPKLKNYVFTRQQGRDTYDGKVEYVSEDIPEFVRRLKQQPGKAIWLSGGAQIVEPLLEAKLVDQIMVAIHPRLLGEGLRLFDNTFPEMELRLTKHEVYDNGLVCLYYDVV